MEDKLRAKIRVSTDQYEFIELDYEGDVDAIWDEYKRLKARTIHKAGLSEREFNKFLDDYISTGTIENGQELYVQMNPVQQNIVQCIKRSIKRMEMSNIFSFS